MESVEAVELAVAAERPSHSGAHSRKLPQPLTGKLLPTQSQVGFLLVPHACMPPLPKDFVCVSKLTPIEAVLKFIAKKVKVEWSSLKLEVRVQQGRYVPLKVEMTIGKAVEQHVVPLESPVFVYSSRYDERS